MKDTFIHIRSKKFPKLPREEEELINPGMYGKALGLFLQSELQKRGYEAPFVCCEDWGWWVELKVAPFRLGVCIYSDSTQDEPTEFACTDGALVGRRIWSWRKLRFIETTSWINNLYDDLLAIFREDPDIEIAGTSKEFPF
jgi:hypothetical protein